MSQRSLEVNIHPLRLSQKLFSSNDIKEIEQAATQNLSVSMYSLMENAGHFVADWVAKKLTKTEAILVLVGHGNNGGDGYVAATQLKRLGYQVSVVMANPSKSVKGDALLAKEAWAAAGGADTLLNDVDWHQQALIIDAMFGTGIQGKMAEPYATIFDFVNQSTGFVLSVDVPSGLDADTGCIESTCVEADTTITFVGKKRGLVTGHGKHVTGHLILAPLFIESYVNQHAPSQETEIQFSDFGSLAPRKGHAHKGNHGKLLCIGGNKSMSGAIRMSAEAALRTGAGLVKVYCHTNCVAQISNGRPELMVTSDDLHRHLNWADCIILGPGLGQDAWSKEVFNQVISYWVHDPKPAVFDADGLNFLSQYMRQLSLGNTILTPHAGEAARLLTTTVKSVEAQRFDSAQALADNFTCPVVLKGAGSVVNTTEHTYVCADGNPGMATAGMGDTLTGILGGLLAQGMDVKKASVYGTCLHARAADLVAESSGQRGMLAGDVIAKIQSCVNS